MKKALSAVSGIAVGFLAATVFFAEFGGSATPTSTASSDERSKAEQVYVPFGEHDDYYLMNSGGHSGQLFVYGVPSMRHIRTVPVFTPDPATGYGYDAESKEMLGDYTWGDFHHPALSETDGDYDGNFLFATDVANNRVAAIDLEDFHTTDIMEVPNIGGPHCAAFVTENTEYLFLPTRFSLPFEDPHASLDDFSEEYRGVLSAMIFDQEQKTFDIGYQVALPPWSYDKARAGKGVSGEWAVITTYNTEEATTNLEINASQADRDFIVLFNWKGLEEMVANGEYEEFNGEKMVFPENIDEHIYLVPVAKSPHGVDVTPDGTRFIASGKLAPAMTVFSFESAFEAIENEDFSGERNGIPVLNYESVMEREVDPPGALGPLHTQFDDRGNAYTSMFISSEVVKWNVDSGEVLDRHDVYYSPGHLVAAHGDTVEPHGNYLVSLNKIAKNNFLSVGPSHPESMDLFDITGDEMVHLSTTPVNPEPHYGQMVHRDVLDPFHVYPQDESDPLAVYDQNDTRIERNGDHVEVFGITMRSKFIFDATAERPDVIEVNEGDTVTIHLTNTDFDQDITHGFGIMDYDLNFEQMPGQTKTLEFVADKSGVFPVYCTNFCSALHQEMTGYLIVNPKE
ncbi:Sec-dependent nitrous-oxide reductase [Desertibacillus haloalkaliphilus]|uniref:Sec-dependent nitrous-oxide reductase n=1 Tax=Desertibacillus haloalkaliphilus TaxID=1328930 RepID=UPI001FEC563E|nr:Sec-dependent nitrous-oxide reductase [Desertibacillus haloalkaliphilus]